MEIKENYIEIIRNNFKRYPPVKDIYSDLAYFTNVFKINKPHSKRNLRIEEERELYHFHLYPFYKFPELECITTYLYLNKISKRLKRYYKDEIILRILASNKYNSKEISILINKFMEQIE